MKGAFMRLSSKKEFKDFDFNLYSKGTITNNVNNPIGRHNNGLLIRLGDNAKYG
jgi:hypothetical protein